MQPFPEHLLQVGTVQAWPETTRQAFQIFSGHLRCSSGPTAITQIHWDQVNPLGTASVTGVQVLIQSRLVRPQLCGLVDMWSTWPFMHVLGTDGHVCPPPLEFALILLRP